MQVLKYSLRKKMKITFKSMFYLLRISFLLLLYFGVDFEKVHAIVQFSS